VLEGLSHIIPIDEKLNAAKDHAEVRLISRDNENALVGKVLVIKTNEELEVAKQIVEQEGKN